MPLSRRKVPPGTTLDAQQLASPFGPHVSGSPAQLGPATKPAEPAEAPPIPADPPPEPPELDVELPPLPEAPLGDASLQASMTKTRPATKLGFARMMTADRGNESLDPTVTVESNRVNLRLVVARRADHHALQPTLQEHFVRALDRHRGLQFQSERPAAREHPFVRRDEADGMSR
jgi:hypothetical protein